MKKKYLFVTIMLAAISLVSVLAASVAGSEKTAGNKQTQTVSSDSGQPQERYQVVTSFYPVYIAAMRVTEGADHISLESLVNSFAGCAHDYQLTPGNLIQISEADLFVINGGGMESFIEDTVVQYPDLNVAVASEGIELLENEFWLHDHGAEHEEDEHADSHGYEEEAGSHEHDGDEEYHEHEEEREDSENHEHEEDSEDHEHDGDSEDHEHDEDSEDHEHDGDSEDHEHDENSEYGEHDGDSEDHEPHEHDEDSEQEEHDGDSEDHEHDEGHKHNEDFEHGEDSEQEEHESDSEPEKDYEQEEEHDHSHDHGTENGHVWMDLFRYQIQVQNIADALSAMDQAHAELYQQNAASYIAELEALAEEMRQLREQADGRSIVIFHEAFAYLADSLGMEIVYGMELDENTSLSAGELASLTELIREEGAEFVLAEEEYGLALAETIAREVDIDIIVLDSLASGTEAPDTYLRGMEANIQILREAIEDHENE